MDEIEPSIDRTGPRKHQATTIGKEIADNSCFVVDVKDEVLVPALAVIKMKIGVVISGGKIGALIPDTANGAVAGELWTRDGRAGRSDVDRGGIGAAKNCGARWPGGVLPIDPGPGMDKMRNIGRDLLRAVAGVRPGRSGQIGRAHV